MSLQTITLETLADLDNGTAGAVVNAAIRAALQDLDDRAEQDRKPRKVSITLTLNKLNSGVLAAHVEATAKVPAYKTKGTLANIKVDERGRVSAEFEPLSPSNPNQKVIEFNDGEISE